MSAPLVPTSVAPVSAPTAPKGSRARRVLRFVGREVRDYPATALFSASWLAVFAAMVWLQFRQDPTTTWMRVLVLGIDGHRFGDLTLDEVFRGQVWRLMTCNFVHYSVIHIGLNLLAFYLLGTLLESWYGSGQFVLIYGLTGGGGNLLSALTRHALGWSSHTHAGGGSVVVMGLVGLCAVVGWRSQTERGSDLGWQMFKALGMTTLLGVALPRYIDNMGHGGGAIVGFALGFLHPWFLRRYGRPGSWGGGIVMGLVIAASGLAQYRYDRYEAPLRHELAEWRGLMATRMELEAREAAYRSLRDAGRVLDWQANQQVLVPLIDRAAPALDRPPTQADYRRLRELAQAATVGELSDEERAEFRQHAAALSGQLRRELREGYRDYRGERAKRPPLRIQRPVPTGPLVRRTPAR